MTIQVRLIALLFAAWMWPFAVPAADPVDYGDSGRWLRAPEGGSMPVDVFYLYPTSWTRGDADGIVCEIDNPSMLAGAPVAYAKTASAFEPLANVYAPYYRQADAVATLAMTPAEAEATLRGIPLKDVAAAFEYFLDNFNAGRPFILAGHSQGSNLLLYLMDTFLKDRPETLDRMIAAYVVGYSVTRDYLAANPHLSFGTGEDDVGVILSWNTESGRVAGNNPVVTPGAVSINPLTWTLGTEYAGVENNLGSLAFDAAGNGVVVPGFASAQIDPARGVVVCDSVDPADYSIPGGLFPVGAYHGSDYPFYYVNITVNAETRSAAYFGAVRLRPPGSGER